MYKYDIFSIILYTNITIYYIMYDVYIIYIQII